ncbi:MAG: hypothetical protein K9I85_11785 [Saprospiraceae bacterium]|nr:hypothetical protein [Saprospiraceae bacterium]
MFVFRTLLFGMGILLSVTLAAQSPLPLSRSAWCDPSPPVGWTDGNGNNADRCYDTGFACSGNDMGRLDHTGEYYLVTFSDTPDELTFSLKDAGLNGASSLALATSPDNSSWNLLEEYGPCSTCTPIVNCAAITMDLDPEVRYIRWLFTKDGGNVGLDDVQITSGVLTPEVGFDLTASTILEGNVGDQDHPVLVTMASPPSGPVELQISDALTGSATPGSDYTFDPVILVFDPADPYPFTQTIMVTIHGDGLVEGDETIDLQLDILSGSAEPVLDLHTITIQDDDFPADWYRTVAGGDWTNTAVWEVSNDQGGSWVAAGTYPLATNSDHVEVLHLLTLDADIEIDDLVISSGATIEVPASQRLEIAQEGPSPQCQLEGTLIDHGVGGTNGWRFQNGARWLMGSNGTLIKTGNSASSEYRDHYVNSPGAPDLPEGSTVIYRYTGGTVSVSSSNWSYGHLSFESVAGYYAFNSLTSRINEFGTLTVKGTLDIGGEGTGTVQVHNQKQTCTTQGDIIIRPGCTMTNESYNGNTPHGLLLQCAGAAMQLEGILQHTSGMGEVRFVEPIVVEGNADHFRTFHLAIGAEVFFSLHAVVTNTLEFEGGDNMITTGSSEIRLQTTVPASILNFGPDAYIEGRLRRDLLAGLDGYDYPVGNASHYAPFRLDVANTDADNLLGYFDPIGTAPGMADCNSPPPGVPSGEYDYLLYCGGWQLTPDNGSNHLMTLTVTPSLAIAPWYTIAIDGAFDPCPTSLTREITAFGAIDLFGADQPLPVTWVDFQVVPHQTGARLIWKTMEEINNRYFTVEYCQDGVSFTGLGRMASKKSGTGEETYVFDHLTPGTGWNYYRIRQEDVSGSFDHSPVRVLWHEGNRERWQLIGPGADGLIRLIRNDDMNAPIELEVVDILGRVWMHRRIASTETVLSVSAWPPGQYFLVLHVADHLDVLSFFITSKI